MKQKETLICDVIRRWRFSAICGADWWERGVRPLDLIFAKTYELLDCFDYDRQLLYLSIVLIPVEIWTKAGIFFLSLSLILCLLPFSKMEKARSIHMRIQYKAQVKDMRIYLYPRNLKKRERGGRGREREFSVLVWGVHVPVSLLNHISTVHLLNWHLVVYCLIMVKSDLVCNKKKYFCIVLGKHSHKSFFSFYNRILFYCFIIIFFGQSPFIIFCHDWDFCYISIS